MTEGKEEEEEEGRRAEQGYEGLRRGSREKGWSRKISE